MSEKPKRGKTVTVVILALLIAAMIAATAYVIYLCINMVNQEPGTSVSTEQSVTLPTSTTTEPTETTVPPTTEPEPVPETVVATASISSQGDLLMHAPLFSAQYNSIAYQGNGMYDFSTLFQYTVNYVSSYDYAIANLETTFGGDDYIYQGNPAFNCPDPLIDSVVETGYDMLLTANNHCGDTMASGVARTVEVIRNSGLTALGTQLSGEEPKYQIVDVNGIKVGMVCYSWAYSYDGAKVSMNGLTPIPADGTINFFRNNNLDAFYAEVEVIMDQMKAAGAEATMMQIHWGNEYELTQNATQSKIAQKLCDIGFDVIVGGHPHVVQPMALLESTEDPSHKTVCIYSLGNAVSNQRTGVSDRFPAGYTEDGVLLAVNFEKYSDGEVYVSDVDVLPTWVNMHSKSGKREYNILPLDKSIEDQWQTEFNLTDYEFGCAQKSYDRTMGIVGEGLTQCQEYLDQAKIDREQYYYDLAFHPEKFETEAPVETVVEETTLPAA